MELNDRNVLLLGGAGLVGLAVARRILEHRPARIVIGSLHRDEAEEAVARLRETRGADGVRIDPAWGDLFVPQGFSKMTRSDILADAGRRSLFVDDLYGELTEEVFQRSALGTLLLEVRPDVVVDSVNTAGALAYQDAFHSAAELRRLSSIGEADLEAVERHLGTLYLPQLIRHVQIALEGMKRGGTSMYVKIGTAGTGGMGLNVPFTHAEERPSRVLLAKAGLAGAHSLLLFLMARTPGAPAVKEVKPTAAISWKAMAIGTIRRGGRPLLRSDALEPLPVTQAFGPGAEGSWTTLDEPLEGVYLDSGENGLFSASEFETLTALGLMEFVTPEEIADNVLREIRGMPSGMDVVAALDGATMGPTYRAGILRGQALERMEELEAEYGTPGVAYEMLGPPRLSKLLFEGFLLRRIHGTIAVAAELDPDETARRTLELVRSDPDLRQRIVTIGLAILLPDGEALLRGPRVKVTLEEAASGDLGVLADRGWVDLRPSNWARWRARLRDFRDAITERPGLEAGSGGDHEFGDDADGPIRPGRMGAWIFRYEDQGERIKR